MKGNKYLRLKGQIDWLDLGGGMLDFIVPMEKEANGVIYIKKQILAIVF